MSIVDKVRKEVDGVAAAVPNWIHDTILTPIDSAFIPKVEMAARSISESAGHRPNSVVQNPDQRNFWGNVDDAPFLTAASRKDSIINHFINDETRKNETIKKGNFLALEPKYDRQTHTHYRWENWFTG